jgi:hypothetical protein
MSDKKDANTTVQNVAKRMMDKYKGGAQKKTASFSDPVIEKAFKRAGGQCECTRKDCAEAHPGRCPTKFEFEDRGHDDDEWQAHHWRAESKDGSDGLDNCEIVCVLCHQSTGSFGRPKTASELLAEADEFAAAVEKLK